jgi:REP element-mobilizing transposase RayT
MVIGYHVILSAYGFWLPNDPRGSWSEFVGAWELLRFGRATKVSTLRSLAGASHDASARMAAKQALKYPPVRFNGIQARAVGRGFALAVRKGRITVWACSILPDHAHLVVARHRYPVEQIANLLKGASTRRMRFENAHPLAAYRTAAGCCPKAWARGQWAVFLRTPQDVRRAMAYVEANPGREGLRRQRWSFVAPFET